MTNLSFAVAGRRCGALALLELGEACETDGQWMQAGGAHCRGAAGQGTLAG